MQKSDEAKLEVTIKDVKSELLEKSPLLKPEKTQKPTPNYISKQHHEDKIRKIHENIVYGNGNTQFLCCRYNPTDEFIAAGGVDGFVHVFNIDPSYKELVLSESIGNSVTAVRWSPKKDRKNVLISCTADGVIAHYSNFKPVSKILEHENQILCMDITADGNHFATAGKDRIIRIYDEEKQKVISQLEPGVLGEIGHANRIFSVRFNPDDANVILSAGWDNNLIIWDIREKRAVDAIGGTSISGADCIDVKNKRILTGSYRGENQLELYDLGKRKKLRDIYWENDSNPKNVLIYGCQFSKLNDETILAGCSGLDEVRVFDPENHYKYFGHVGDFKHHVFAVDFAHHSDNFAYCGSDGHVHTVKMTTEIVKNEKEEKVE